MYTPFSVVNPSLEDYSDFSKLSSLQLLKLEKGLFYFSLYWNDFYLYHRGKAEEGSELEEVSMLPVTVDKIMKQLSGSVDTRTSNIESIYLYGSVALEDYIEGSSDIDFIAFVREPLSQPDIQAIAEAHEEVEAQIPKADLMGTYLLLDDITNNHHEISPQLTYFDKQTNLSGRGADLNPITWWILKNRASESMAPKYRSITTWMSILYAIMLFII